MIKKTGFVILFSFIITVFLFNLVSAAIGLPQGVTDVFSFVVGDVSAAGSVSLEEVIIVKFLVFILLLAIINTAVQRIPGLGDTKGIAFLIALVVSLIGTRFLTSGELINFIWLPYGTLSIVLSSLLPFIIAFFFFQGFDSTIIRKVGWTSFLVIFIGLAYFRWDDFSLSLSAGEGTFNLAWIYLIIAIISGLLLVFDKNIHAMFILSSLGKVSGQAKKIQAAQIVHDIEQLRAQLATAPNTSVITAIKAQIKQKEANLKALLS